MGLKSQSFLSNSEGQADGVHVLLTLFVLALFIALGFACYMLYQGKETNTSIYKADSKPFVQQPEYTSHFGCNNVHVDEYFERKLDANIANNQISH